MRRIAGRGVPEAVVVPSRMFWPGRLIERERIVVSVALAALGSVLPTLLRARLKSIPTPGFLRFFPFGIVPCWWPLRLSSPPLHPPRCRSDQPGAVWARPRDARRRASSAHLRAWARSKRGSPEAYLLSVDWIAGRGRGD